MSWKEGTMEAEIEAPDDLRTARSYLDTFYQRLSVPDYRQDALEDAREAESVFEKKLFYTLLTPKVEHEDIGSTMEEMKEDGGRPGEVVDELQSMDQQHREYSQELLEEAEEKLDSLFNSLRILSGDNQVQLLNDAEENYEAVLEYARNRIQDRPNIQREVDEEVNALRK